jgi:hypothetical protein
MITMTCRNVDLARDPGGEVAAFTLHLVAVLSNLVPEAVIEDGSRDTSLPAVHLTGDTFPDWVKAHAIMALAWEEYYGPHYPYVEINGADLPQQPSGGNYRVIYTYTAGQCSAIQVEGDRLEGATAPTA